MEILVVLLPFIVAALLGRIMFPYILLVSYKKRLFDPITDRKLHKRIIPRLGGVAFAPIQCCLLVITLVSVFKLTIVDLHVESWAILPSLMMLVCGLFILFIFGIGDDLIGVGYKWKFILQVLVACLFPLSGLWVNDFYGLLFIEKIPPILGYPFTVFVIVLIINSINLMDGLDGLCSGIVGIGCLLLGALFIINQSWLHALFSFITAGVLIPFFYYNVFGIGRRKRQLFMGDTGSMTLGFSLSFLAISFAMDNVYIKPYSKDSFIIAFSILVVPVFDVIRVICYRWKIGKPIFQPDCNHLHHKLLRAGWSRRNALMTILVLTLTFSLFNIICSPFFNSNIILCGDIMIWIIFDTVIGQFERKKSKFQSEILLDSKQGL